MRKNALADGIAASANARSGAPANMFNEIEIGVGVKKERGTENQVGRRMKERNSGEGEGETDTEDPRRAAGSPLYMTICGLG